MKLNKQKIKALEIILKKLKNKDINWKIMGSTNLVLQGVDIKSEDIDISTNKKGAYLIDSLFKKYVTKKVDLSIGLSKNNKYKSYFGKLKINNVSVDIIGNLEYFDKKENKWIKSKKTKPIFIEYKKCKIPLNNLKDEFEFYKKYRKDDTYKKIAKKIDSFKK